MHSVGYINLDHVDLALDGIEQSLAAFKLGSKTSKEEHLDAAIRTWIERYGSTIQMEPRDEQTSYHFLLSGFRKREQTDQCYGSIL